MAMEVESVAGAWQLAAAAAAAGDGGGYQPPPWRRRLIRMATRGESERRRTKEKEPTYFFGARVPAWVGRVGCGLLGGRAETTRHETNRNPAAWWVPLVLPG